MWTCTQIKALILSFSQKTLVLIFGFYKEKKTYHKNKKHYVAVKYASKKKILSESCLLQALKNVWSFIELLGSFFFYLAAFYASFQELKKSQVYIEQQTLFFLFPNDAHNYPSGWGKRTVCSAIINTSYIKYKRETKKVCLPRRTGDH